MKTSKLQGVTELNRALAEIGTEMATKSGVRANGAAARYLAGQLKQAAPHMPGVQLKTILSKRGGARRVNYGDLRDNIKAARVRSDSRTSIRHIISTGRAFWARFLEFGTVSMPAHPFFRSTLDRVQGNLPQVQLDALRKDLARIAKKAARSARLKKG